MPPFNMIVAAQIPVSRLISALYCSTGRIARNSRVHSPSGRRTISESGRSRLIALRSRDRCCRNLPISGNSSIDGCRLPASASIWTAG